jgi:hypothetical protein
MLQVWRQVLCRYRAAGHLLLLHGTMLLLLVLLLLQ